MVNIKVFILSMYFVKFIIANASQRENLTKLVKSVLHKSSNNYIMMDRCPEHE